MSLAKFASIFSLFCIAYRFVITLFNELYNNTNTLAGESRTAIKYSNKKNNIFRNIKFEKKFKWEPKSGLPIKHKNTPIYYSKLKLYRWSYYYGGTSTGDGRRRSVLHIEKRYCFRKNDEKRWKKCSGLRQELMVWNFRGRWWVVQFMCVHVAGRFACAAPDRLGDSFGSLPLFSYCGTDLENLQINV